ncbi:dihydroorotate dehydrogenase electron transfer subunit [Dendrosporobacter sp. 1207_IL3150]|uniref:dihydroorotate dehydrogenase electron transfer subunit n=1 Tax=Dendrosporobacter sp. 1207_IL3150 TaxID=3084054 RepID=UPI002FD8EC3F
MSKLVVQAPVLKNETISNLVKRLTIYSPELAGKAVPGQFIHVKIADSYHPLLRRPLSISDVDVAKGTVSTIYRIVGHGTALLAQLKSDEVLDCMGPLGRGFNLECKKPLLVGGGMGLAPLVFLAQRLCPRPVEILMGGRSEQEMFWSSIYSTICDRVHIATDDGSVGQRGFTVDLLPELLESGNYDMVYSCGPRPMLEKIAAIAKNFAIPCQVSLEEHMACGVGACLSCTCAGKEGKRKKVCTDGPVFWAGEVF